jgi:hypothetical protein
MPGRLTTTLVDHFAHLLREGSAIGLGDEELLQRFVDTRDAFAINHPSNQRPPGR